MRWLAVLTLAVAAVALGGAFGSEWYGGLVPCALCLVERWPYRVAAGLGIVALLLPRRWLLWAVVGCMVASAVVATIHVGVEQGAWPSPLPECAAPKFGSGSLADRLSRMPDRPSKPCDEPTFLVPGIPVSMAAMNLALALAFGGFLAMSLTKMNRNKS